MINIQFKNISLKNTSICAVVSVVISCCIPQTGYASVHDDFFYGLPSVGGNAAGNATSSSSNSSSTPTTEPLSRDFVDQTMDLRTLNSSVTPKFENEDANRHSFPIENDVLVKIFSYLDDQDLANVLRTCQHFYHIGNDYMVFKALHGEFVLKCRSYVTEDNQRFVMDTNEGENQLRSYFNYNESPYRVTKQRFVAAAIERLEANVTGVHMAFGGDTWKAVMCPLLSLQTLDECVGVFHTYMKFDPSFQNYRIFSMLAKKPLSQDHLDALAEVLNDPFYVVQVPDDVKTRALQNIFDIIPFDSGLSLSKTEVKELLESEIKITIAETNKLNRGLRAAMFRTIQNL